MSTAAELASEIIAIAHQRGKGIVYEMDSSDEYTVEEGVSTLVAGTPVPLLVTIRDALRCASGDSQLLEVLSALIRKGIVPYLEMLDECDPADPDTPSPLTEKELVDLELKVKLAPILTRACAGVDRPYVMTNIQLISVLAVSLRFADRVLDDLEFPFPYVGERAEFREQLTVASLLVFAVFEVNVDHIASDNSEARTRWMLDLHDSSDQIIKYAKVCHERGVIDWDLIAALEEADGSLALAEGIL